MTYLSKQFSVTNDNSSMENDFTSKISYLAKKEGTENILNGNIPQLLPCDNETRKFLEMLTLPEIKRHISSRIKSKDFVDCWEKAKEKYPHQFWDYILVIIKV